MRSHVLSVLLLASLPMLIVAVVGAAASLEYTVTIAKGNAGAHVRAEARGLEGPSIELTLCSESLYVGRYISDLGTNRGTPQQLETGRWKLPAGGDSVIYEYNVARVVPWQSSLPWAASTDVAVYIDDLCAVFMVAHMFVLPEFQAFTSIQVAFDVPDNWVIVAPWEEVEPRVYRVSWINRQLIGDFKNHHVYMGQMEFYAEDQSSGSVVKLGRLIADDAVVEHRTQAEIDAAVEAMTKALGSLTDLFGENPFPVYTIVPNFRRYADGRWYQFRPHYIGNSLQYWPERRWDELIGHATIAWMGAVAMLNAGKEFYNGMGENYYGLLYAWELYADPVYLTKRYLHYLLYEWMHTHHERPLSSYHCGTCDEYDVYFRWEFICLLLDREIQRRSSEQHTLADAVQWLYERYANPSKTIVATDLEQAIEVSTGTEISDVFRKYVYQDTKLPVYSYIEEDRALFLEQAATLEIVHLHNYMHGHIIPWFVNIVMAAALGEHLPHALLGLEYAVDFAEYVLERHDLNALSEADVVAALSSLSGIDCSGFFTYWEDTYGVLSVLEFVDWLTDYSELERGSSHPRLFNESGRGSGWGAIDGGDISWSEALEDSVPVPVLVTVSNASLIESRRGCPTVRFGVEFCDSQGWGDVVLGVDDKDKRLFSHEYDDWHAPVKYFETINLPVAATESGWEGKLYVLPVPSITRFTVGQGEAAFGVDITVEPSEDGVSTLIDPLSPEYVITCSGTVRVLQVNYVAPEPYIASFTFRADSEEICILASGRTVWDSIEGDGIEIILRPVDSPGLGPYRFVARGTSLGWSLFREFVYTRERELVGDLQAQVDASIHVCIPRSDVIRPGTSPDLQIRIKCDLTDQDALPIWYVPNLPTGG